MSTLNVKIPVPTSGYGSAVDVSDLLGEKTVVLSGKFHGVYVLYGAHDSKHFVPILTFNAGGIEGIRQTFSGSLRKVKLRSLVTESIGVEASISGLKLSGNNSFASFGVLGPGSQGPQGFVDLGMTNYQVDLNFIAQGSLRGTVLVEGSLDGRSFNPIGNFSADPSVGSLLGGQELEFSPLRTSDKVRYVRLNIHGEILGSFTVTIGGAQGISAVPISAETLHESYAVGISSIDQTLSLTSVNGGKVVFDATDPGFADPNGYMVEMLGSAGGVGGAFLQDGGMVLGPENLVIGMTLPGGVPSVDPSSFGSVIIGCGGYAGYQYVTVIGVDNYARGYCDIVAGVICNTLDDGGSNVVAGFGSNAKGQSNVVIGNSSEATSGAVGIGFSVVIGGFNIANVEAVALGYNCQAAGNGDIVIGSGSNTQIGGSGNVVIGVGATADGPYEVVIGNGASASGGGFFGLGVAIGFFATADIEAIVIGSGATGSYGTIAMGESSVVQGYGGIGIGASVNSNSSLGNQISIGNESAATGNSSVAIGGYHPLISVLVTNAAGDFSVALGTIAQSLGINAIAIGSQSTASGDNSMAFGNQASAGTAEIVFSSAAAGGANKFEVVGSTVGNPDLFSFDVAQVGTANTTAFSLLVTKKNGTTTTVLPVTLSPPDLITNMSTLQVLNN